MLSELLTAITPFYPVIAAVFLASYLFVVKTTGSTPEKFDLIKFSSTLIVGAGIAVFSYMAGSPLSTEAIGVQLAVFASAIIVVENAIKVVVRTAVYVNISALSPWLPKSPAPLSTLSGVRRVAAIPVVESVPVAASGCAGAAPVARSGCSGPAPVVPVEEPAPVVVDPTTLPGYDASIDNSPRLPANKIDTVDRVAVKFYPAIVQGVSPLPVTVHAIADPAEGIHAVTRGIIDWKDGSPIETFTFSHGVARLSHVYSFVQRDHFDGRDPCKHYAHEFYPELSVISLDGLTTTINNEIGRSLMITVKDAEAVAAGKVTNYPAPQ